MRLADRLRRWWNPAQWRDEHPGASEPAPEPDHPLNEYERLEEPLPDEHFWDAAEDVAKPLLPKDED